MAGLRGRGEVRETFRREALPHLDALYRFAVHKYRDPETAQDLVQETYKEAWSSFSTYRPGTNCKAWLFRIFFRVSGRIVQAQSGMREVDLEQAPPQALAVAKPDESVDGEVVLSILDSLPEKYRTVLVLADAEELSYREISELLQVPLGTVMSRLSRARALFREKFLRDIGNLETETA